MDDESGRPHDQSVAADRTGEDAPSQTTQPPELARRGTFPAAGSDGPARRGRTWAHLRLIIVLLAAMAVPVLVMSGLGRSSEVDVGPVGAPDPGAAAEAPATAGTDAGLDVDGDGSPDRVTVVGGRVEVVTEDGSAVYTVGGPGDQIVVGDWDCDGTATPALYRPDEGVLHRYDEWPTVDEPERPVTAAAKPDGTAVRHDRGACDVLVVR